MNSKKKMKKKKTFKVQSRINNSKTDQIDAVIIDDFVQEYKSDIEKIKDMKEREKHIIDESNKILEQFSARDTSTELLHKYEAWKIIMENLLTKTYKSDLRYIYPDYYDPDFNTKIFNKKEFRLNKIPKRKVFEDSDDEEEFVQKMCNPSKEKNFNLTHNQKFLKSFISPDTPYNSILLFHGTGVGKTCTSISVAEQYTNELKDLNKKIFILLNPSIKTNFQKNIFNIQKIRENLPYYQCTGEKYLKEINVDNLSSNDTDSIEKKINKIIKNRYEFYGYKQFANKITRLQEDIKRRYKETDFSKIFEKKIKDIFSNSVMIIDEVHNIKKGAESALVPPLLEKVVKIADNMKLLLLSATPMFDTSTEIIFLLNLMLMNDNRPKIKLSDFFDKHDNLIESQKEIFKNKIQGYISYMRGEDPYRFPKRLYAEDTIDIENMPITDKKGNVIDNPIETLQIVGCVMEGYQKKIYENMEKIGLGNFNQKGIMCSNIIYPNNDMENIDNYNVDDFISHKGFSNILKIHKGNYTFKDPSFKSIFKIENIKQYSTKIASIIDHIKRNADTSGIIFIYSQFINNGLIPLALALEYMGYSKYKGSLIDDRVEQKGNYIIISGEKDLSSNAYSDYIKLQHLNKHGEKIKIILGSESAAEGLDFSYIREVHILDPWFHLNKIEQVIGRGIRNCSHIDLKKDERNVRIYLYASIKSLNPRNDIETIDLEMYRKAEQKSRQMGEIEYLLKTNSVDCEINIEGNKFLRDGEDIDGSKKCNYRECDYKCNLDTSQSESNNTLLLNESIIQDSIDEIKRDIIELFKQTFIYKIDDIVGYLIEKDKHEKILIFLALNDLIINRINIKRGSQNGHIIYKNGYYIFQKINSSKFSSLNNIRRTKTKRINSYNISNNVIAELSRNNSVSTEQNNTEKKEHYTKIVRKGKDVMNTFIEKNNMSDILQIKEYMNNMKLVDKERLIHYLIDTNYNRTLTPDEETIIDNMYNIVYNDDDTIWGYKIVNNKKIVYKKYSDRFIDPSNEELIVIKKLFEKKKISEKPPAQIIGYYEYKVSDNSVVFKIRDKNDEGKKGTQKKTGSICNNGGMKKDKIIQYIEYVLDKVVYSNIPSTNVPNKPLLCRELEKVFQDANVNPDSKFRYLYNPEETIEYELNKK